VQNRPDGSVMANQVLWLLVILVLWLGSVVVLGSFSHSSGQQEHA